MVISPNQPALRQDLPLCEGSASLLWPLYLSPRVGALRRHRHLVWGTRAWLRPCDTPSLGGNFTLYIFGEVVAFAGAPHIWVNSFGSEGRLYVQETRQ